MIHKPMLAGTVKKLDQLRYPIYATPKLDGIRCLTRDNTAVSRKFKPIRNNFIRAALRGLPNDLDGELMLRSIVPFNQVSSAVMSEAGEPDFVYNVFDYAPAPNVPYLERIRELKTLNLPDYVKLVTPIKINNEAELLVFEKKCLTAGYEGVMIRSAAGPYKFGRSTIREGWLLKFKRFFDSEAVVIGFIERIRNENVQERDELGYAKRSSCKANLVPAGMLGTLMVRDIKTGLEFGIGSGLDDAIRQEIWDDRKAYLGKIVKYKYQGITKNLPRFPTFLGFRSVEDFDAPGEDLNDTQ